MDGTVAACLSHGHAASAQPALAANCQPMETPLVEDVCQQGSLPWGGCAGRRPPRPGSEHRLAGQRSLEFRVSEAQSVRESKGCSGHVL